MAAGIGRLLRVIAVLAAVAGLLAGWRWLAAWAAIATGYAAKQLCSGVWVSGLPPAFVIERDIEPRMAILGPALPLLETRLDPAAVGAASSLLGVTSQARFMPPYGCVLNPRSVPATESAPGGQRRAGAGLDAQPTVEPVRPPAWLEPLLDDAFAEPRAVDGRRNTLAVVVRQRGQIIAERYRAPVTATTPLQGWSMNKSLLATWVGIQVARGALSLEQSVLASIDPADRSGDPVGNIDPRLTLGHLLHMESGFDFEETYNPGDDATAMLYGDDPMWQAAPRRGHRFPPGTHFSYSSGDTNLAAYLWQRSLAGASYTDWLREEFIRPLGLGVAVSEPDVSGVQVGSSYTYMSARDWSRVGQLWLDAWHGRSPLLERSWQRAAVTPRPSTAEGIYGRGFWLNTRGVSFPGLPEAAFFASGNSGQYVLVLPEEELVIVRLGLSTTPEREHGVEALARGILERQDRLAPD
jgi:CubicO group peptidase (beta-lactamase class C family)